MIPAHWPKLNVQPSPAFLALSFEACCDLIRQGLLRIEGKGFVPNVSLEKTLQYAADPWNPAMNRSLLAFQLIVFLENHREFELSKAVNSLLRAVAPPLDRVISNERGGATADPEELAELRRKLRALDVSRGKPI
jgi:hypothetical protein